MPLAFLLAMQAAGMVVDWMGKENQIKMARMGEKLEEASINANIVSSRLQTEDASLMAMKKLRQNMGSQMALFAARGQRSGAGNALIATTESIGNFNADERMRKINQLTRENQFKAEKLLSKMHQNTYESNIRNEFTRSFFNKLPTNPEAYGQIGNSFGFTKV